MIQKKQIIPGENVSFVGKNQVVMFFIVALVVSSVFAIPLLLSVYEVIRVDIPDVFGLIAAMGSSIAAVIVASLSNTRSELKKIWLGLKKQEHEVRSTQFRFLLWNIKT